MIKYEVITSIDDAVFERLYNECKVDMDAGSYPWHLFPRVSTDEQKIAHLKASFLSTAESTGGLLFRVVEDGRDLMINAGTLTNASLFWFLGLIGNDASGSKSYLYRSDYIQARDAFWVSQGISSWRVETMGAGTAMYDHLINAINANTISEGVAQEEKDLGPILAVRDIIFTV